MTLKELGCRSVKAAISAIIKYKIKKIDFEIYLGEDHRGEGGEAGEGGGA